MKYYQVSYMVFTRGKAPFATWTVYDYTKDYNPNILTNYLRNLHNGETVHLIEPVNEISKERFDELKRLLSGK